MRGVLYGIGGALCLAAWGLHGEWLMSFPAGLLFRMMIDEVR